MARCNSQQHAIDISSRYSWTEYITSSTINFHDKSSFWSFYNGGYKFYEKVEQGVVSTQGSNLPIDLFLKKIVKSEQRNVSGHDANGTVTSPMVSAISEKKFPLKEGFLLKKGAFLSGWKGKYFGRLSRSI